jgi:hypothetical protein
MLCREETEEDHRAQALEQADAGVPALPVPGRLPGELMYAAQVGDTRPAGEEGAGRSAEAAGRVLAVKRRQKRAHRL